MVPETYYIISRSGAPSLQQMKTGYDVMKTMHCKACNYVLVRLVRPFLRFITHSFCILKVKIDLRHFYYVLMDLEQTEVIGSLSLDLKSFTDSCISFRRYMFNNERCSLTAHFEKKN